MAASPEFWPGCRFSSATKAATSPSMTVAFQVACRSVVHATNFGLAPRMAGLAAPPANL